MNCFNHDRVPAVGICAVCQKAVCRQCIGSDQPHLVCNSCLRTRPALGFEYRSAITIGSWPLVHICAGVDPVTMRPRVARGVIAIGNIAVGGLAVGGLAVGGLACGLLTLGGASFGLLFALGGAAIGLGLSMGGFAVGSVAIGGAAVGLSYAIGGAAFGPSTIDGRHCDPAAVEFFRRWLAGFVPSRCR